MKKSIKKTVSVFLFISMLILGLAGCSSISDGSDNTDGEELKPFRIGVGGQDGGGVFEGAALAVKNAYFEEELREIGFKPKYVYFGGAGPEINEAFAAGEIDAAILGDFPAFVAKSKGIDNKVIATTNQKCQYGILINSDEIKTAKDLEGKKVIVAQGTIIQFFWEKYVEAVGIDASKVEIINATSDTISLLQAGEADAYVANRYMVSYLTSSGLGNELENEIDISNIYTSFIFEASSSILDENPELGVAVNKALIHAQKDAAANPDAQYQALASDNVPAEAWKDYYSVDTTLSNLSPEITTETLEYYNTLSDWMLSHSIISEQIDVSTFIDNTYYQKAVDALNK